MEKKWKTAMNMSSLIPQATLIGYKQQLPQSAIGYIVVSHTDENGVNRLENYGNYFFDINAESDYDNIIQNKDASNEAKKALVPWTCDNVYQVPKGTRFIANNGVEFFSTATCSTSTLKKPWNRIINSTTELEAFYKSGGWNGIKYIKVPVMQGIQRVVSLGITNGVRFETLVYSATDIENASNVVSAEYFKIRVTNTNLNETWVEIDRINRAGPYDKVFEKTILKDGSGVKIKFGDGITGAIPKTKSVIMMEYVETLGAAGNIDTRYSINQMMFPSGTRMVDPRTGLVSTFLNCTNICPIQGGKDMESIDEFRDNAPTSYMKSYTISTNANYLNNIKKFSPLNLMKIKIYPDTSFICQQVDASLNDTVEEVLNEVSTIKQDFKVTALLANGEVIPESEVKDTFINPLILSLGEIKSVGDSISYVAPNLIQMAAYINIKSSDLTIPEDDIRNYLKIAVADEFDIYNQDFNEPLNKSSITSIAKKFSFSDSVNVTLDAIAKVNFDDIQILDLGTTKYEDLLVAIPFNFDAIFAQDKYAAGFKNCELNSDYLLKVDLQFINDSSKLAKNRTFFLYDQRTDESGATTLQEGKNLPISSSIGLPSTRKTITASRINESTIIMFDETSETFYNRQVRIAQFPYISEITDAEYMTRIKSFNQTPIENRPYETDTDGSNRIFSSNNVEITLQVSLSGESGSVGSLCYKKNTDYIDNVDIIFYENYQDPNSSDYARGYFIMPLSYFEFLSIENETYNPDNQGEYLTKLHNAFKQYISLKIYATPRSEDFYPKNVNDIIYISNENIKVKKSLISNLS